MKTNTEQMGAFILELRKSHKMTQKELAARLYITDKAVSKWERGLSCPDISLLASLADIFGITTSELLNGKRNEITSVELEERVETVLEYADQAIKSNTKNIRNIGMFVFSGLCILGMLICAICDLAISGGLTWSMYPICSTSFTWLVLFPMIKFGKKGVAGSFILLSVSIVPFLYILSSLINNSSLIMPIGMRISVILIVFLGAVFALFKRLKLRKWLASAYALLLADIVIILINLVLSKIIGEPVIDVWDIFTLSIVTLGAIVLFIRDYVVRNKPA